MKPTDIHQAVHNFAGMTHGLSDSDLNREWSWKDYDEGVRFAFFRVYEKLRQLGARLGRSRSKSNQPLTTAQNILAQYHAAYRDLQAVLIGVSDADAARPPAEDEWPVRTALLHIIAAERTFFAINLDALQQRQGGEARPLEMSDEAWEAFWQGDEFDGLKKGAPTSELMAYYDRLHGQVLAELAGIRDEVLGTPVVFWESTPMSLEFRLHRFDSHMRQHTIQIEKTLQAMHIPPTEAKRLLRLIYAALAEAEGFTIGLEDFGIAERAEVVTLINVYCDEIDQLMRA